MAIKNFKVEENQKVWDLYMNSKLQEGRPKMSVNQYKPPLLALEELTGKSFAQSTIADLEQIEREGKNLSYVKGFLLAAMNNEWVTLSKDLIVFLIPVEYRKAIQLLMV